MNSDGLTLEQSIVKTFKEHGLDVKRIAYVPDILGKGETWEVVA